MNEDLKKRYPWLEETKNEKFLKLWEKYDEDTTFHCNNCNEDVQVVYMDDYSCPYCNAPKSSLTIIEEPEYYKNMLKKSVNFIEFWYFCKDCKYSFDHREYIENDFLCPECTSNNIIKYKDIDELETKQGVDVTKYYCNECHEPYTMTELKENMGYCPNCNCEIEEEYNYACENCYEQFTSFETENIKCPHCNYVHESLEPIEFENMEPGWEPTEEEWEDIQFSDE